MNYFILLLLIVKFFVLVVYFKNKQHFTRWHFTNLLVNLSYAAIYYGSKVQMKLMNTKKQVNQFIKTNPKLRKLIGDLITNKNGYKLIREDKEVLFLKDLKDNIIIVDEPYDFMIYINNNNDESIKNVICIDFSDQSSCAEKADFKFILTEVTIKNLTFPIHFVTDEYNYMMTGNELGNLFMKYFLRTYYTKYVGDEEIKEYKVKILDQNMESIEFGNKDVLLVNKNNYSVRAFT